MISPSKQQRLQDGSVQKALIAQARGPAFGEQRPPKSSMVVRSYDASTREAETGRSPKLTSQLVLLNREAPDSVRDAASKKKR